MNHTKKLHAITTLAILLGSMSAWCYSATKSDSPNIVLIMCDDLGWGDVGFNGGTIIKTPHLDRMAADSLRFTRFYAQSPVCSPTRGSCLTGRHPYRYGIYFANTGHMKSPERTLAELLSDHGYTTGHFGKWHLGTLTKTVKDANRGGQAKHIQHFSPPQENGFDVCFSTESKVPTYDPMRKPAVDAGNAWDPITDDSKAARYGTHYWNEQGEIVTENLDGANSRIIMDRAVPFIEDAVGDNKAFFAVIWFHTPHLPVVAGQAYQDLYRDEPKTLHRNYYGCVSAMDEQVGRLQKTLLDLNVADDTMVCFCSDNGPEGNSKSPGSAGPFRGRKRSLYEGGIRVPGLIHWPRRIAAGRTTDYPAVTSDYLPTIVEMIGAKMNPVRPVDGVSLMPVIQNRIDQRPNPIGFQSRDRAAWANNRFKLIGSFKDSNWELYDLTADPSETNDLAAEQTTRVASMDKAIRSWQKSCEQSDQGKDYPRTVQRSPDASQ